MDLTGNNREGEGRDGERRDEEVPSLPLQQLAVLWRGWQQQGEVLL